MTWVHSTFPTSPSAISAPHTFAARERQSCLTLPVQKVTANVPTAAGTYSRPVVRRVASNSPLRPASQSRPGSTRSIRAVNSGMSAAKKATPAAISRPFGLIEPAKYISIGVAAATRPPIIRPCRE